MPNGYVATGTAVATAGSKTVTFSGVSVILFRAGNPFLQGGASGVIASIDADANTITLEQNWGGASTPGGAAYSVITIPQGAELAESTRTIMQYLGGPILSIAALMGDNAPSDGETLVWDSDLQGWTAANIFANPTFTGTLSGAAAAFSGNVTAAKLALGGASLGSNALAVTGTSQFNGFVSFSGNVGLGNVSAGNTSLYINAAANQQKVISLETANKLNWIFGADNSTQSGGNAGSNFTIINFDDNGTVIGQPLTIIRSTGVVQINSGLRYGGITLANSVTGTGSMVLSNSPTFTGAATITSSTPILLFNKTGTGANTWQMRTDVSAAGDFGIYNPTTTKIPWTITTTDVFDIRFATQIDKTVTIGTAGVNNSVDPYVLLSRNVDNSGSGNAHGYSDSSQISRGGGIGYASFDGRINVVGSNNLDHIASFQYNPTINTSGTISRVYGVVGHPTINGGTVTNAYQFYAAVADGSHTAGITNLYAYVSEHGAGNVGFGTIAPDMNLVVYDNPSDAAAKIAVLNDNSVGTAAQAAFLARNGTHSGIIGMTGRGFTTTGWQRQDGLYILSDGDGGTTLVTSGTKPIYFAINGAEAARLGSDSNLIVGTTTEGGWFGHSRIAAVGANHVISAQSTGTGTAIASRVDATGGWYAGFYYGTSNVGSIAPNGTTGVSYNVTSARDMKMGATPLVSTAVLDAKMYRGSWIAEPGREWVGGIADEMGGLVPEGYTPSSTPHLAPHQDGYIPDGFDYSKWVPHLIVQEQAAWARMEAIEARLAAAGIA